MDGGAGTGNKPRVTIIVSPRERFGMAEKSLQSIFAATDVPFDLVYIDARSPARLSQWLKTEAAAKGFRVVHVDRFVTPNESRNLGLAAATTEFVVFIDNDVICSEGWLSKLVQCADETGADVMVPLTCEGFPFHSRVHQASGKFAEDRNVFFATPYGEREIVDQMAYQGDQVEAVRSHLRREETDTCEFHCVMVRRSVFDRIGPLDENMYATKEHFDFCMSVLHTGGKIIFEPTSVVTYVFPNSKSPVTREDVPYFLLRWSPEWQIRSLDHMQKKWGLRDVGEFHAVRDAGHLQFRHYEGLIKPLIRRIPIVRRSYRLSMAARKILTRYFALRIKKLVADHDNQRPAGRVSAVN